MNINNRYNKYYNSGNYKIIQIKMLKDKITDQDMYQFE